MPKRYVEKDKYFQLAKKKGYRARSAFKLLEIQEKFKIIKNGASVLDLGCFPGSWLQVENELVGEKGVVAGIDLEKPDEIPGVKIYTGSIEDEEMIALIKSDFPKGFDAVLSDMAPKTSGIKGVDQYKSVELNLLALEVCKKLLRKGGNAVFKVFVGEDFEDFNKVVRGSFKNVKQFKPRSTRDRSFEVYVVCKGFLA